MICYPVDSLVQPEFVHRIAARGRVGKDCRKPSSRRARPNASTFPRGASSASPASKARRSGTSICGRQAIFRNASSRARHARFRHPPVDRGQVMVDPAVPAADGDDHGRHSPRMASTHGAAGPRRDRNALRSLHPASRGQRFDFCCHSNLTAPSPTGPAYREPRTVSMIVLNIFRCTGFTRGYRALLHESEPCRDRATSSSSLPRSISSAPYPRVRAAIAAPSIRATWPHAIPCSWKSTDRSNRRAGGRRPNAMNTIGRTALMKRVRANVLRSMLLLSGVT